MEKLNLNAPTNWRCFSKKLAAFLIENGCLVIKKGIKPTTGDAYWEFLYAEIKPYLEAWANTKPQFPSKE